MVVRIRFGRGPRVERRKGKNSKVAWLAAGLLTLASVNCLILGLWRLGVDFGWTGDFPFPPTSFLSHWQVWLVVALLIEWAAWRLNRYGKPKNVTPVEMQASAPLEKKRMAANI